MTQTDRRDRRFADRSAYCRNPRIDLWENVGWLGFPFNDSRPNFIAPVMFCRRTLAMASSEVSTADLIHRLVAPERMLPVE
jgi:hypothetical protein